MKGGARPVKVAGRAFENLRDRIGDSKLSLNLRLYNTYDPYDSLTCQGLLGLSKSFRKSNLSTTYLSLRRKLSPLLLFCPMD